MLAHAVFFCKLTYKGLVEHIGRAELIAPPRSVIKLVIRRVSSRCVGIRAIASRNDSVALSTASTQIAETRTIGMSAAAAIGNGNSKEEDDVGEKV